MSYKVEVRTAGDNGYCGNGLRFKEKTAAEDYAIHLSMRWLAVRDFRVVESEDRPNQ